MTRPPRAECTCGLHRPYSRTRCLPECPCRRCYENRHKDVYRARGAASKQLCVECAQPAKDWAQLTDTTGTDPWMHYQPMCLRCHRAYDGWGHVMGEHKKRYWQTIPPKERNQSPETRAKNSEANRRRWAEMPPEERTEIGRKIREAWANKPKKQKAEA